MQIKPLHNDSDIPMSDLRFFFNKKNWIRLAILSILFIILYLPVFMKLMKIWWENNAYSHGFIVPFISLYLIWIRKNKLKNISAKSDMKGIALILIASFVFMLGDKSSILLLQGISFPLMIAGVVLLLLGKNYLKLLIFPIAYLLFMVPYLDFYPGNIHRPLQIFTAKIGTLLLQSLGVPVFLKSMLIELPNRTLEVATECSGLHYLTSIIAIGIPLAVITQKTLKRKILLVSMAVGIAIVFNAVRVALIGLWVYHYNPVNIHGPFHILQGVLTSQIGFVVLFIGAWYLSKIPSPPSSKQSDILQAKQQSYARSTSHNTTIKFNYYIIIIFFIFSLVWIYTYLLRPQPITLKSNIDNFPRTISKWKWNGESYDKDWKYKPSGTDAEITRRYTDASGREITIYIGYFETQHQGKEFSRDSIKELKHTIENIEIPLGDKQFIIVNKTIMDDSEGNHSIFFWYDVNGKRTPDMYNAMLSTTFNGIFKRKTNGAIIMLSSKIYQTDMTNDVIDEQKQFINNLIPILADYLPS